jgi:hypothetical protein
VDERLALYMDACHCTAGNFCPPYRRDLGGQGGPALPGVFCECMEKASVILRMNQDYSRWRAGHYAPIDPWRLETVTMEALASMGRYDGPEAL